MGLSDVFGAEDRIGDDCKSARMENIFQIENSTSSTSTDARGNNTDA